MTTHIRRPAWILYRLVCILAVWLVISHGGWHIAPASAQSGSLTWSRPENLSNTLTSSDSPAIVADGLGYVHVFWSEEVGGRTIRPQDMPSQGNTIFYTRWDGVSWTPPIDVLFMPNDSVADFPAVAVDTQNRLHVVWTGYSNLYYSNAPSWNAYSASAWSKPVILAGDSARSAWMISIAADAAGILHVVYATRGSEAGVYYIRSVNGGADWEPPIKLSSEFDTLEESFARVKIITDGAGRLHAVWQTNESAGFGQAVYYARSQDGGKSWSSPLQMGYRGPGDFDVGWPYITARGDSELHLIYNAGPSHVGRFHRISRDGGETWSNPLHVITEMEGINGYIVPIVDGAGQMHLIINMRTVATQVVGIYYAHWLETDWSPVVPLATESPYGPSAHFAAATVRLGNEVHVVWTTGRGAEIWHLQGTMPGVTPAPALTKPSLAAATPTPTTQPAPGRALAPTRQPVARLLDTGAPGAASAVTNNSVLYGIGVPFLLVLGALTGMLLRARRR